MNAKRFKTLNGFWTNISPVKEGKKNHNYAEASMQTGSEKQDKVLFFFEKPNTSSKAYESALTALRSKQSSIVSSLTEDSEGKFLTCRTSEVKDKNVTFERRNSLDHEQIDLNAVTNSTSSSNDDTVTISGRVIKLDPQVDIKKYDNILQKKLDKKYRTAVLANTTGAVIVMLWENMCDNIKENDNVILKNLRLSVDANGQTYFTTTFKSEFNNTTIEYDEYDEQSVVDLLGIHITLFKTIFCTVDSVVVDIVTICPRCKTRSTCDENLAVCSNTTCAATFKTKTKSIKTDLIVTENDEEKQHNLVVYKDLLFDLIGNTDKNAITNYFMANDNTFNIRFHHRSKTIDVIDKIY